MSRNNVFPFDNNKQSDALTQIVIRHCIEHEDVKNSLKESLRPFWSLVEQADFLRKLFVYEVIQCLTDNKGRYPEVTALIIMGWSRYIAYTVISWAQIYQTLDTDTQLPPSSNGMTGAVYRILAKSEWWLAVEGAQSYKEGGEMLRSIALTSLQKWLDYPDQREGYNFGDTSLQVIFHSYAYAVQWEKVVQALYDKDENEHLIIP